jgi:putative ABC transport system permease protein
MSFAWLPGVDGLSGDLLFGLRSLARRPGFAIVAVLALALGIGANTAIFSAIDAALLRPLPYPAADRLVFLGGTGPASFRMSAISGGMFTEVRSQARSLVASGFREYTFSLAGGDKPESVRAATVSRDFFEVLGAQPILGRTFTREVGGPREIVLGEALWRSRFGSAQAILGQTVTANGEPFVIVGVMAGEVGHPFPVDLWASSRFEVPEHVLRPLENTAADFDSHYLDAIARLRPGVTLEQARAELDVISQRIAREHSDSEEGRRLRIEPLREYLTGSVRPTLLILFGAVALILLIACANVANLLLARAVERTHETAIRVALGATRLRLLRLFFSESLVLAVAGGALGILLALWTAPALAALGRFTFRQEALRLDWRVLCFTLALCLCTALAFGLLPVLLRPESPADALKESGRTGSGGTHRARLRTALVVAEMALALMLLIGAGLSLRSFVRLASVDPGFDPAGAAAADVALPQAHYPNKDAQGRFYLDVLQRLRAEPGVEGAGAVSRLPLSGGNSSRDLRLASNPSASLDADYRIATPGYFEALRIPLRAGRTFSDADIHTGARVALVNETLARLAWPGRSPIGERLSVTLDNVPVEVVGVIGDVRHNGLDEAARPEVYIPVKLDAWPMMTLVARGRGDLTGLLQRDVWAVDSQQALAKVATVEERVATSLRSRRFAALLLVALAAVAFALAVTGIYGVMSYSVAQRTREVGIRLALGATPGAVLRLVLLQAMRPVLLGAAAGIAGALSLGGLLRSLLFGVSASDPATFAGLAALLCATAAIAALVAARRATRVDPALALRAE